VAAMEGVSLVPVFRGRELAERVLCWEHEGHRAVREGKWKLVALAGKAWELYDLEADRAELKDLAGEMPERVRSLEAHYRAWAERCGVKAYPVATTQKKVGV